MAKIDMGAHIDGFIAVVAHSIVISDGKSKTTGRKADAMLAAHLASEAALRLVKPGNEVLLLITINYVINCIKSLCLITGCETLNANFIELRVDSCVL